MTTATGLPRTDKDIRARIEASTNMFGFDKEVLAEYLSFEGAEGIRKEGMTEKEWGDVPNLDELTEAAHNYLNFAIGKIEDHRGISASRSVDKLTEYAWLLGRDDIVTAMGEADYAQYGAPKVKVFSVGFGWWPQDPSPDLVRMSDGLPCTDDCEQGCGR